MMLRLHRLLAVPATLLAALALGAGAAAACGVAAVCADVEASFSGTIVLEGIRLEWATDEEDASTASYRISRYDCGDPAACSVYVGELAARGECSALEEYVGYDAQPSGGPWTYRLAVWASGGSEPVCTTDTVPE